MVAMPIHCKLLQNQKPDELKLGTWYVGFGMWVLPSLKKFFSRTRRPMTLLPGMCIRDGGPTKFVLRIFLGCH